MPCKTNKQFKLSHEMLAFANMLAHELKTPLAVIALYIELLDEDYKNLLQILPPQNNATSQELTSKYEKKISKIKKAIYSSDQIIKNLGIIAKVIAYEEVDRSSWIKLSILSSIRDVINSYPFQGVENKIIKFDPAKDFYYIGDANLTRQVLFNLIKNSLYMLKGSASPSIIFSLASDDYYNIVNIVDNGAGIEPAIMPNIFNNILLESNLHPDAGLGLAFCRRIMQYYRGNIACESKAKSFTKFSLYFPKI